MTIEDVRNRFLFHPATDDTGPMHDEVRTRCLALAESLLIIMPPGRHASLALTTLEETMHWANAAIACDS
jgi:hypothetical protein